MYILFSELENQLCELCDELKYMQLKVKLKEDAMARKPSVRKPEAKVYIARF